MINNEQHIRFLIDAQDTLKVAKDCIELRNWRAAIQNLQSTVELSAKAIISVFEEVEFKHDPGPQLRKVIERNWESIKEKFSEEFISELLNLADWCPIVEPWHWWSIYGKKDAEYPKGISATELCTEEKAKEFLPMAEKSFELAQKFIKSWIETIST